MSPALYLGFVAASALLIALPGPNVALICANSLAHGRRMGLVTVAGTSAAAAAQLSLTAAGMASIAVFLAQWFEVLRWAGVAYLLFLAVQAFRTPPAGPEARPEPADPRRVFLRGLLVGLTNPKTMLFYGAFLPQFVSAAHPALPQLVLLAMTFLAMAIAGDSLWALLADRLKGLLAGRGRLRSRVVGAVYLAAGAGLAGARAA